MSSANSNGRPTRVSARFSISLVRHLHAFVKDVELTEAEWFKAIEFLTATGHMCTGHRQEFILLSDTLGVSMVVDLLNHSPSSTARPSRRCSDRFIAMVRPSCRWAGTLRRRTPARPR